MCPVGFMMWPVKMTVVPTRKEAKPQDARAPEERTASAVGVKTGNGDARGARRARRCDAANRCQGAPLHPGAEWLRKVDADQDHHARMLPAGARRIIDRHPWEGALEYFRAAFDAGHRFTGPAGILHDRCNGAGRGAVGFLQQHAYISAP